MSGRFQNRPKVFQLLQAQVILYEPSEHLNVVILRLGSETFNVMLARIVGLVLEEVHYNGYNQKHGRLYGGIRFPNAKDAQKEFLDQRIFRHIVR